MSKLTKPARVGNTIFGEGVDERLVIERAYREHEYHEADKGAAPWEKNRVREFVDAVNAARPEARRQFEEQPFAWAVKLESGVESLVYHPIEGTLELKDGDVAYPLFREVYTQEQLD